MTLRVIVLNGPPGSGKDFIGKKLAAKFTNDTPISYGYVAKFAQFVKIPVHYFLGLNNPENLSYHEKIKDMPAIHGCDKTLRQGYINFSEDFAKPTFGEDIFGKMLAKYLHDTYLWRPNTSYIVITDGGFAAEQYPVYKLVGKENYIHVNMFRDGTSFDNDSRSYLNTIGSSNPIKCNNNSDADEVVMKLWKDIKRAKVWQ